MDPEIPLERSGKAAKLPIRSLDSHRWPFGDWQWITTDGFCVSTFVQAEIREMRVQTVGFWLLLSIFLGSQNVRAELVAYEGFDYLSETALNGQGSSGNGFNGDWRPAPFNASIHNDLQVGAASLQYGLLESRGGSVTGASQQALSGLVRDFADPFGRDDETIYLSVLLRPNSEAGVGLFGNFFGLTLETSQGAPELFMGRPGSSQAWSIEQRGGGSLVESSIDATVGRTDLLVLRADLSTNTDLFTLYVNPQLGLPEPNSQLQLSGLNLGQITGVGLYYTGAFTVDEIRVGRTFGSVTSVPEPCAFLPMAISGVGIAVRRKRSRSIAAHKLIY
jgi:hypothetical protein